MARRRNSLLQALECFRAMDPGLVITDLLVFLYVCENEGLNVKELAQVSRLTEATASRRARALGEPEAPGAMAPAVGLLEAFQGDDGRARLIYLTEKGRRVRDQLQHLIGAADPIVPRTRTPQAA
jgi:DNA-binding MarR family transcriptional regulator